MKKICILYIFRYDIQRELNNESDLNDICENYLKIIKNKGFSLLPISIISNCLNNLSLIINEYKSNNNYKEISNSFYNLLSSYLKNKLIIEEENKSIDELLTLYFKSINNKKSIEKEINKLKKENLFSLEIGKTVIIDYEGLGNKEGYIINKKLINNEFYYNIEFYDRDVIYNVPINEIKVISTDDNIEMINNSLCKYEDKDYYIKDIYKNNKYIYLIIELHYIIIIKKKKDFYIILIKN